MKNNFQTGIFHLRSEQPTGGRQMNSTFPLHAAMLDVNSFRRQMDIYRFSLSNIQTDDEQECLGNGMECGNPDYISWCAGVIQRLRDLQLGLGISSRTLGIGNEA